MFHFFKDYYLEERRIVEWLAEIESSHRHTNFQPALPRVSKCLAK